jgi:serine/threonine-protein kinase
MKTLLVFLIMILLGMPTQAQYVTTIAGNGTTGAVDSAALFCSFNYPTHICQATNGTIYISDHYNNKIRKLSVTGEVTTFAGSGNQAFADGIGNNASFDRPSAICLDNSGNLFVTDGLNQRIRKIDSNGVVTTFAGSGTYGSQDGPLLTASFSFPTGICTDGVGNFYITEYQGQRIRKILPNGMVTTLAGSGSIGSTDGWGTSATFNYPRRIAIHPLSGMLYVTDYLGHKIRIVDPNSGNVTTYAGTGVAGFTNGTVSTCTFNRPDDICFDATGNAYVVEWNNNAVRKITTGGIVTTAAGTGSIGSSDGFGASASFNAPTGIYCTSGGEILITDGGNQKIRKMVFAPTHVATQEVMNGVTMYPNPVSTYLFFNDMEHRIKEMYNLQGVCVARTAENALPISGLPKGIYIIRCNGLSEKVVVE